MNLALFLLGLLALAVLLEPLAERLKLPTPTVLVVVGFVVSEAVVGLGGDTGVRWHLFHDLVIYLLLPALIFEASLHLRPRKLLDDLAPILIMAGPFLLLSTGICALVLHTLIGDPVGFPWSAAFFTGAILSATDPVAVLSMFKKLGVPVRLSLLVDGESLFNDATAIVVAMIVLGVVLTGIEVSPSVAVLDFGRIFAGGVLIGAIAGGLGWLLLAAAREGTHRVAATVVIAYGGFLVSEDLLHVSGIMTTLTAGLMLSWRLRERHRDDLGRVLESWAEYGFLANALMFLLMGVTVTTVMFSERWLAMLIGIGAALLARALTVYLAVPAANLLPGVTPVPTPYRHVLYWGGLRGAVTIALVLALPLDVEWWFTAQSIAYGVVLFSLFVQAPTMPALLRRVIPTAEDSEADTTSSAATP